VGARAGTSRSRPHADRWCAGRRRPHSRCGRGDVPLSEPVEVNLWRAGGCLIVAATGPPLRPDAVGGVMIEYVVLVFGVVAAWVLWQHSRRA
jgi:hypothetical protein